MYEIEMNTLRRMLHKTLFKFLFVPFSLKLFILDDCHVKIPTGAYKLIPFYKGENTVFDVSPPSMFVSVGQDHAIVPEKFQV